MNGFLKFKITSLPFCTTGGGERNFELSSEVDSFELLELY